MLGKLNQEGGLILFNNRNNKGDIWAMYQVVGNNIQFLKTQQWIPMLYGLIALGGIVGLSKLFKCSGYYNIILPICMVFAYGITVLSTYYVLYYEEQLCKNRKDLKWIVNRHFSPEIKARFNFENYEKWGYDNSFYIPFLILLILGFASALSYFIVEGLDMNSMPLWLLILSIVALASPVIFFSIIFNSIKKIKNKQNEIECKLGRLDSR